MEVAIGSDHAGVEQKSKIIALLKESGIEAIDCGCYSADSVDYPDIAEAVAARVLEKCIPGIIICGTGIGISIAANKIPGIRAALCSDPYSAEMARRHNDANVLALGARVLEVPAIREIVSAFLAAEFEGGRHQRRVDKINAIEKKYCVRCC
ncbi:MAG: ribose 5-phosphate isomerase B [Syntrophomonadaceae bacterium]|nr:ribose 5-phosphate isomerase B [Syntrophomonadaceae bacterium]